jgi:ABC-type multidrug transport system fused ATPase/permease subunit
MARLLLRSVIPAVRVMLSAGAILYINLQFSLLIFVIIGIPIAGLYWVSKKIADTITSRESGSQPVFAQQLELLSTSWENKAHLLPGAIDQELALGQAGSRHRLYFKRLRAKTFGQLLMNTANTLGLMVLVLSLGFWILQEEQGNWSLWLTYLLALRYFFTSLNRVAQAVVQSARFNRQVRRFMEFLAAATLAANGPNPENTPCPDHVLHAYQGGDTYSDDDDLDED